jgi:hypothetical protein
MNQFGAELVFEGGDLFADGRLTDATFFRDSRKAPFFDYPDEHLHCVEFVHTNLPIPLWNGLYFFGIGFTRLYQAIRPSQSHFHLKPIHSYVEWLIFPESSHQLAATTHQIAALKNREQVAESADRRCFSRKAKEISCRS